METHIHGSMQCWYTPDNRAKGIKLYWDAKKIKNPKLGLVNIQKTCDDECFKWCMLYHQSEKSKHDSRLTVLKKIKAKYKYDGINFPASYEDIEISVNLNWICVMVYEIEDDMVVLS